MRPAQPLCGRVFAISDKLEVCGRYGRYEVVYGARGRVKGKWSSCHAHTARSGPPAGRPCKFSVLITIIEGIGDGCIPGGAARGAAHGGKRLIPCSPCTMLPRGAAPRDPVGLLAGGRWSMLRFLLSETSGRVSNGLLVRQSGAGPRRVFSRTDAQRRPAAPSPRLSAPAAACWRGDIMCWGRRAGFEREAAAWRVRVRVRAPQRDEGLIP